MKKNIVTFFDAENFEEFIYKEEYKKSYQELAQIITEQGGHFFISKNYKNKNIFLEGLLYKNKKFVPIQEKIEADVIYKKGKGDFDESTMVVLNQAPLEKISWDKLAVAQNFSQFSPQTESLKNLTVAKNILAKRPKDQKLVLKPFDAFGGAGIFIGKPEAGAKFLEDKKFPYLYQEFVDTSGGIPGIFVGVHDLRIIGMNGEIIQAFIRTAPAESLLSNVSEGGSTIEIPLQKIPKPVQEIFHTVDEKFSHLNPRLYSVDLARGSDGIFKLLEITAQPALFSRDRGPSFARFQKILAQCLLEA